MNLSTARSSTRAREVGIRKVLGSIKGHLVRQFLLESIIITGIATIIAIVIASFGVPFFNTLTGKSLIIPFTNPWLYVILLGVVLGLGFAAGIYPSLFLSNFKPVQVLKGRLLSGRSGAPVRSLLVIVQFSITIFLLLGTAAVYKQLNFIQNKKLGFNKEQVILVRDAYMLGDNINAFKNSLIQHTSINAIGVSGYLPIDASYRSDNSFWVEGRAMDEENMVSNQFWRIDEGYIPTLDLEIVEGRNFSLDFPSDSSAIILNETAVKAFGLTKPIGARIQTFGVLNPEEQKFETYTVVGVVKDFHFNNMRQAISPLIFSYGQSTGTIAVRFNSSNTGELISLVREEWENASDGIPFSYDFLEDEFREMYTSEKKLGEIFVIFAVLATIIGGLGLFGLAAYLTEQRTKEIGIRKVLGASTQKILWLVSRDFAKLVLISFILAIPFGWYFIKQWLVEFEYKTNVGWEVYAVVGLGAFLIAILTISYQSIHAALTNPAETIRNE
jgi:putative ABC transport system permease protein